jgi:hypothetical protein|tara:strand:- start:377 stop:1003 length:627 start_codon:yes stop_codon:yes gene_type:complete
MAEYEKNRKVYETNLKRRLEEQKKITELVPQYVPESQQTVRTIQRQQDSFLQPTQDISQRSSVSPQQKQQGGLGIFKDVQYLTTSSAEPYIKIYDSSIDGELRDIIFVNSNTTANLTFDLLLSRVDITNLLGKNKLPNQVLDSNKDSVFLARNMLLAQAGTAPNNPKQLSLSEIVGTTQILSSGIQKPFYIYVYKTGSTGRLDVTVMK